MVLASLEPGTGSILLLVLLIAAFVVAFKIMEMVFETILASVVSAGFYLSLAYFFNFSFSLERALLFAFLGATLYMGYSFLAAAYGLASTAVEIPYRIVKTLVSIPLKALKALYSHLKKCGDQKYDRREKDLGSDDSGSKDVKEVVLDKVRDN